MIVLDTHVLLWVSTADRKLGRQARGALERAWRSNSVAVAAITFWEIAALADRGRIKLPASAAQWRASLLSAGLVELPMDGEIAIRAEDLSSGPEDPADRFIAATALCRTAALMTADTTLLAWQHPLARIDARR